MKSRNSNRLPITAIVVGLNESEVLENCLSNLTFCEKVIYFDLGSEDDSVKIAEKYSTQVFRHAPVPFVEILHSEEIPKITTDWVLLTDPDEVVPSSLQQFLFEWMEHFDSNNQIGTVVAPIQYFFRGKALRGTAWGGINSRLLMAHKSRVDFAPQVHLGRKLQNGFNQFNLPLENRLAIEHYWMRSWRQLITKHHRYLAGEGEARYLAGQRVRYSDIVLAPFKAFVYSFFSKQGYKDGITGFSLSVFWAWYQTAAQWSTRTYERRLSRWSSH